MKTFLRHCRALLFGMLITALVSIIDQTVTGFHSLAHAWCNIVHVLLWMLCGIIICHVYKGFIKG